MISILLVDDDHASLGAAGEFYKGRDDVDLDTAGSASEALEKINLYSYDAVVSDYLMPGMNGVELWKRLRAEKDLTPFIIYADQGWEDLVVDTLGNEDVRIYLRNGELPHDLRELTGVIEDSVRAKAEADKKALLKENYELLLSSMHEGILTVDGRGKIEYANHRMADLLGRSEEEIIGNSFLAMLEQQDAEVIARCLSSHGESMIEPVDISLSQNTGERIIARLSASPRAGEGKNSGMLFIATDVTALRRAQKTLEDELECLREIVHKSADAVIVIDGDGAICFGNPAAASLFNSDAEQMRGDKPGFPLIVETPVTAGILGERHTIVEMRMAGIEWDSKPAYLATLRDVTGHYEVQAELRKVRDELYGKVEGRTAELIETNRTLLSEVSEKNQAITAMGEANARAKVSEDMVTTYKGVLSVVSCGIVQTNKAGVDSLGRLIDVFGINKEMTRLLSLPLGAFNKSTGLAGDAIKLLRSQEAIVKPMDIMGVLEQVKARYPPGDRRISIGITPTQACPVEANDLLEDALAGIVENAIARSMQGKQLMTHIEVARVAGDTQDYCRCTIEDNAPGVSDDEKNAAFLLPKEASEGLGLFLVKAIIEGFHGKVWVEDRVQGDYLKGCKFVVLLPAK